MVEGAGAGYEGLHGGLSQSWTHWSSTLLSPEHAHCKATAAYLHNHHSVRVVERPKFATWQRLKTPAIMEDVLKLLTNGDVTPFTFPAGLLSAGAGSGLGATNLELALALQTGAFPSFLMSQLSSGPGGPLPLPQALALPSLELPKLLSLDVGIEGAPRAAAANVAATDVGNNSDPSGSGGSAPPRSSRVSARQQQLQQLQQQQQQYEALALPTGPAIRDVEEPAQAGRSKRQFGGPSDGMADPNLESARAAATLAYSIAATNLETQLQQEQDHQRQAMDASNSDGSDTSSGSAGAAPARSAPNRGARRSAIAKDPAARAQIRQLKKRDLNREAQRRFRDRQKAALALLESTTQSQQREIEALRISNKVITEQYQVLLDQYKALQLRFVAMQMKTQNK